MTSPLGLSPEQRKELARLWTDASSRPFDALVAYVSSLLAEARLDAERWRNVARTAYSDLQDFHRWRDESVWQNCEHKEIEDYDRSCKRCGGIVPMDDGEAITFGAPYFIKSLDDYKKCFDAARGGPEGGTG